MPPECEQLLRTLERATARLADPGPLDAADRQQGFEEREQAIAALVGWIAAEQAASRPVSPELASRLSIDIEAGTGILVRMAIDREAIRVDLAECGRDLQVLRGLKNSSAPKPQTIDCRG